MVANAKRPALTIRVSNPAATIADVAVVIGCVACPSGGRWRHFIDALSGLLRICLLAHAAIVAFANATHAVGIGSAATSITGVVVVEIC